MAEITKYPTRYLTPHFTAWEMRCRCKRGDACDAPAMRREFMSKLEALRLEWGEPLHVISATRCAVHNNIVGGVAGSQHLIGNAADLLLPPQQIEKFIILAEKYGFQGIGAGPDFVHVDNRQWWARWTYE